MSTPVVFSSYSHDSDPHRARVRGLCASLSRDGCDCRLDVFKDTDEDWPTWMTRQLLEADFVFCVITETYARRFRDQELPDQGLGVGWEAPLIRRLLYARKLRNDRIFPVLFDKSDRDHIPIELQAIDYFVLDGAAGYEALLRKVWKKPLHTAPVIGTPPRLESGATPPLFARPGSTSSSSPSEKPPVRADISRILKYAPAELIGREEELKLLNDAWLGHRPSAITNPQSATRNLQSPRVLTFVALGGEGKTSLVAKWAADLAAQGWPGCDAVFAWSFYSQGTREQLAASSDLFLKEALNFFATGTSEEVSEIKAFAASPAGAFEKGQRLARLVGARRNILILDGLEPLQYAPTAPTPGELKDQGVAALLKGLAQNNFGLCLVTTRYSLPDLRAFWQTTAPEKPLVRLSKEAGVHLLQQLGVRKESGSKAEFETLVEDVKGHALTLTLLGGFLKRAFHGDIRQRDRVKFEKADAQMDGGHAFRAMAAYEQWLLRDGGEEGRREVAVLRLLGLFDRPADAGCLQALLQPPAIPGLTEPLVGLADDDWEFCLSGLESARLLTISRDDSGHRQSAIGHWQSLDAHPHLREYFAAQVRSPGFSRSGGAGLPEDGTTPNGPAKAGTTSEAWRAAHRRLYEHLCASTPDKPQPTLEDLQPLYQAVAHGCQAGLQMEVCVKVYRDRIQRSREAYSTKKLGAVSSDLAVSMQ